MLFRFMLGGAVLAGVIAHGTWQARKAASRQPKRALEPVDGTASAEAGHGANGVARVVYPSAEAVARRQPWELPPEGAALDAGDGAALPEMPAQPPVRRTGPKLDALIDAIATITLDAPNSGDHLLLHVPSTRRAGSKPLLVEALRVDCNEWELPQPGVLYKELQAGVLMANRTGALN